MRQSPEDPPDTQIEGPHADRPGADPLPREAAPRASATSNLAALRDLVAGRGDAPVLRGALPLGIHDVDSRLAQGGLALGQLHEIAPAQAGDEPAALGFALALVARHLARVRGEALLVVGQGHPLPYGHGLAGLGLDPARLLLFEVASDSDAYRALEESLRSRGLAAVAGLVDAALPLAQSRRLHLAAGRTDRLLLVLRPPEAESPNVAATRWRIAAGKALRDRFGCIERPCWQATLDRSRNGRTGHWLLEWDHAAHRFGLAGALAGHTAEAGGRVQSSR
ncbi:ImuA protein [Methylobacterium sp.]|uniref:ImuA family protein n=1 Tax=Methylobacterium sp. TaxID=409 RepID=UPI0025E60CC5|nr:ImuA protein [Methylobacterium sp.]